MQESQKYFNELTAIKNDRQFEEMALRVFEHQYKNNLVYHNFCNAIDRTTPQNILEIPFLPISFFKTHSIIDSTYDKNELLLFKSSGTTLATRSKHYIASPSLYKQSFTHTFEQQISPIQNSIILALLPNYIEQGHSSLVYMVNDLINASQDALSGFYLSDPKKLVKLLTQARKTGKKIVLFGVAYTLLDLAEEKVDLNGVTVIETGGMKGRRKEMIKSELHEVLKKGLNVPTVYSEYGMTELLSQAYSDGTEYFKTPRWMNVLIRDINDPFTYLEDNKTGGVNVIDLANIYSCAFIATDDLGVRNKEVFKIMGRFDFSDIRGCNLLVN